MSFDEQFRPAFDNLAARLRRDVDRHLDAAIEELHERADKIAQVTELERATVIADAVREARLDAEQRADERLAASLAEADTQAREKLEAERQAAEQRAAERLAQVMTEAESANQQRLAQERQAIDQIVAERIDAAVAAAEAASSARYQRLLDESAQEAKQFERAAADRVQSLMAEAEESAARRVAEAREAAAAEALTRAQASFTQLEAAAGRRLTSAFRDIDTAHSLSNILDTLVNAAAAENCRAALFLTGPSEIKSWRFVGFEPTFGPDDSLSFPLPDAGIVGDAIAQKQLVATGEHGGSAPVFADLPAERTAVAVPIVVNGEVVTVLYADEGTERSTESPVWSTSIELLARHASRALEAITAHRLARTLTDRTSATRVRPTSQDDSGTSGTAPALVSVPQQSQMKPLEPKAAIRETGQASAMVQPDQHAAARAYAQELVSAIRLRNEALVIAAVRDRDLMGRLGPEIARAWSLYEARVPQSIRTNTNYFHSEMVRTLADGDASLLTPTQ